MRVFRADYTTPVRHHHETSAVSKLLLIRPGRRRGRGSKTVVVKTENAALAGPVQASYLLIDTQPGPPRHDGRHRIDTAPHGRRLTLAADYWRPEDASYMVLVGRERWRTFCPRHAAVRPITPRLDLQPFGRQGREPRGQFDRDSMPRRSAIRSRWCARPTSFPA